MISCYFTIGQAYLIDGKIDQAIMIFQKSYDLSKSIGNSLHVANARKFIGICYRSKGKYEMSWKYLNSSLDEFIRRNHPFASQVVLFQ